MGTNFRIGDAVVCAGDSATEGRVERLEVGAVNVRWPSGLATMDPPSALTLIRRPVQPGDRLRYRTLASARGQHAGIAAMADMTADGTSVRAVYVGGGWDRLSDLEHADGTPIDIEGSLEQRDTDRPAPALREGDVVEHIGSNRRPFGVRGRVAQVSTLLDSVRVRREGCSRDFVCEARDLRLLRRPARIGDLVTWGRRVSNESVIDVGTLGVKVGDGTLAGRFVTWDGNGHGNLTHADGTEIDREGSLAAVEQIASDRITCAACGSRVPRIEAVALQAEAPRFCSHPCARTGAKPDPLTCDTCGVTSAAVADCGSGNFCTLKCAQRATLTSNVEVKVAADDAGDPAEVASKIREAIANTLEGYVKPLEIDRAEAIPVWAHAILSGAQATPATSIDFAPGSNARRLAFALFATDPEVLAFVEEKSDAVCRATTHETRLEHEGRPSTISVTVEKVDDERRKRVLAIAWDRNESNWRERAEKRAAEVVAAMKGDA